MSDGSRWTATEPAVRLRPLGVERPWSIAATDVMDAIGVGESGLTPAEATHRLRKVGPNQIEEGWHRGFLTIGLAQFRSPLIYLLIIAAIVTLLLREFLDAAVIAIALTVNASIGFIQEYRAERSMAALRRLVQSDATVLREGAARRIGSRTVVPGDIILLEAGEKVPADARILSAASLQVDESILTGESTPVSKQAELLPHDAALSDRTNMLFTGTLVTVGRGRGVVVATGQRTEVGRIATTVGEAGLTETPLQVRIGRLARLIVGLILATAAIAFLWGLATGYALLEIVMVVVGLTVATIPEGLPIVLMVVLAVGTQRMAQRRVIVRRLPAVETLGSCTVIGSDKTGTLTENRMTVQRILAGDNEYEVVGEAYGAEGEIRLHGARLSAEGHETLDLVLIAGTLCNEARVTLPSGAIEYDVRGDPTEIALLVAAARRGLTRDDLEHRYPRIDEIPFDSERAWAATFHRDGEDELLFLKGAPERVLPMCDAAHGMDGLDVRSVLDGAHGMAEDGRRVLAMAYRALPAGAERPTAPSGLVFLGLQAMIDPPRPEVVEAVRGCQEAGIRVLMITGDHPATGLAIGRQIGIAGEHATVMTGAAIEALDDEELAGKLATVRVFARMAPEHKHRVVRLLQQRGEVVAVTGDGVNDAPALKAADIGVAMGRSGTDVAREASDMVVTDDTFASIFAAVRKGRVVFDNVRKATFFLVSTAVAVMVVVLASLIAGFPLPFVPVQLIWLNLVTDGTQDAALGFEPAEPDVLNRPPRSRGENVIDRRLWERIIISGVWMAAGTLALFFLLADPWEDILYAQSIAVTTMVLFQAVHLGNSRSETVSAFRKNPLSNRVLVVCSVIALLVHTGALHFAPTQYMLRVTPIHPQDWAWMLLVALTVIPVVELHKRFR